MGQQQLLLIVLGVIIVGIAVVVGINLFNAQAISANRNAVISDLNNLGTMAMQYYKKPTGMLGGGNSFVGFDSTHISGLSVTANGTYTIGATTQADVKITGIGNEKNDAGVLVNYTATVTRDGIALVKNN